VAESISRHIKWLVELMEATTRTAPDLYFYRGLLAGFNIQLIH
jgi:hypothetical protein